MPTGVRLWATFIFISLHLGAHLAVKIPLPDPSFVPGKSNVTVSEGDIATLPCTVQNLGTRQVSWRRMGSDHFLTIGADTWVRDSNLVLEHAEWPGSVSDWNLVFKETRLEDAGTYECQVIHTKRIMWRVTLNVIRTSSVDTLEGEDMRADNTVSRPAIAIEGKEYVESGDTVYLLCNTTEGSRIPDDVDWFKDGDKIDKEKYPQIVITKYPSNKALALVSELIIERAKNTDSGTYICRSSLEQIASLDVTVLVGKGSEKQARKLTADSSNVKRGSGSSQTTRLPSRGENRAVTSTFLLGDAFIMTLLAAFISVLTCNFVIT